MAVTADQIRTAVLQANPALSRFDPLSRIVLFDEFRRGMQGWTEMIGNYEHELENFIDPHSVTLAETRPPMLSSSSMWDTGTAGGWHGTYSMKIATRARRDYLAKAIKRISWRQRGRLQCEAYFTYGVEASELKLGDTDFKAFGFGWDFQEDGRRWMPSLRYVNAEQGQLKQTWTLHVDGKLNPQMGEWETVGTQPLCYNEIATKQNWHYLRWVVDLRSASYVELQCNDKVFDISGVQYDTFEPAPNLWCMLNAGFWVEAGADKRAWLQVDSMLVSTDV